MKRLLPALAALAILASLAVVVASRSDERAGVEEPGRASEPENEPARPARRKAPKSRAPAALPKASMSGRTVDALARPLEDVELVVIGPVRRELRSGAQGHFLFSGLPAGEYVLHARHGVASSEPLGPIPLAPGEELRDLTVVLETGAALSGTVRDARTREPLEGVALRAAASLARSDAAGRFRLEGLPGGRVSLRISREGYAPRTEPLDLQRGRERTGTEVFLEPAAKVHGRVQALGLPLPGAQVLAARYGFAAGHSTLEQVGVTGEDGRFEGDVLPGRIQLLVQVQGFAEARSDEVELHAGETREVNLTVGAGATIFGALRDVSGAGVGGCRIEAFDAVHGRVMGTAQSGTDGRFWIGSVPQAVYVVAAGCDAGRAEQSGVSVAEGQQVEVNLSLGGAMVSGRVLDGSGRPVGGARIGVKRDGSAAPETIAASSRQDGTFELRGLAGERFTLSATSPEGRTEQSGVPAGARSVVLTIGSGELRGTVWSARSGPLSDFGVYAEPQDPGRRPRSQRFVSPSGEFVMPLEPGRYRVTASAHGHPSASEEVTIASGRPSRVRFTLPEGARISGVVVDGEGAPVAGARVASHFHMLWAIGRAAPVPSGALTTSGADGRFVLDGVSGETVRLFVEKEGFRQPRVTSVKAGPGRRIDGVRIVLERGEPPQGEEEFGGVGMTLTQDESGILVAHAFAGGPAREAGIRSGDRLLAIDGVPVAGLGLQEVIGRVRGVVGSPVQLRLVREGREFSVALARASVKF